ncbi:hypothetical protein LTR37_013818 [Vermiconidia calcicola]|uniref:Uncharacterized protein n=1 Tax=Vermiconidia calcicola TaxID=1690605 RepID=A0ACC3MWD4_9PEZI|nr:hypothetical protein LTR37_013818 [Vermiconidia calcicola]
MSGSSSWNTDGFAFAPNTNAMDAETMPSDKAQAAREKALEVMNSLKEGKAGEADKAMGPREPQGQYGILPLDWFKHKFSSGKKDKKAKGETVVR